MYLSVTAAANVAFILVHYKQELKLEIENQDKYNKDVPVTLPVLTV